MTCCDNKSFSNLAKNRITIESQAITEDAIFGNPITWTNYKTVWSILYPKTGKEIFKNGQLQSRVSCVAVIRYDANLQNTKNAAKYRVTYNNRYFNILAINNVDNFDVFRKEYIEGKNYQILYLEEGGNNG